MSIKQSSLEKKSLYRIAKIFFLLLPWLVLAVVFLGGYIIIPEITQQHIIAAYIVGGLILYYLFLNLTWRGFLYIVFGGLENDTKKPITARVQPVSPITQPVQKPNQAAPVFGILVFVIILVIIATYSSKNTYGTNCSNEGEKGLYGTDGGCYTCTIGDVAGTSPANNCSVGTAGVYCCNNSSGNNGVTGNSKCVAPCGKLWDCGGTYYPPSGVRTDVSGCFTINQSYLHNWNGTCIKRCN